MYCGNLGYHQQKGLSNWSGFLRVFFKQEQPVTCWLPLNIKVKKREQKNISTRFSIIPETPPRSHCVPVPVAWASRTAARPCSQRPSQELLAEPRGCAAALASSSLGEALSKALCWSMVQTTMDHAQRRNGNGFLSSTRISSLLLGRPTKSLLKDHGRE